MIDENDGHPESFYYDETKEPMVSILITIEGRVQGVGFRQWITKNAEKSHITGWVRNRPNHTVEALFHGPESIVRELIQRCYTGPSLCYVKKITEFPMKGFYQNIKGFSQLPTG